MWLDTEIVLENLASNIIALVCEMFNYPEVVDLQLFLEWLGTKDDVLVDVVLVII